MKNHKTIWIPNGDQLVPYRIYRCERCDIEVEESWPLHKNESGIYCKDCAFILGFITEEDYLKTGGIYLDGMRAAVHNGEIYLTSRGGKFPWEKSPKKQRNDPAYIRWRQKVFERDGYRCQICGKVGGTLNAHHIKSFAKNEDERLNVYNGVTLCEECHRRVHRERDSTWIK